MEVIEFGTCCTARIIENWGDDAATYAQYKTTQTAKLKECCNFLNEDEHYANIDNGEDEYNDLRNLGLIFATVTTNQKHAIKFAKEVGFRVTKGAVKGRHPETRLIGMFIDSVDLYNWSRAN